MQFMAEEHVCFTIVHEFVLILQNLQQGGVL